MKAAERPVIVVDVEVRRYGLEAKVAALAHRLGAPVVTTFMGRGLLSGHADIVAGTYMGVVTQLVEDADAALLLGVILSDTNFALSQRRLDARRTMLAIDRTVTVGHHSYAGIPLDAVVDAVTERATPARKGSARRPPVPTYRRNLARDGAPIMPADIACAINDLFTARGAMPMTSDVGDCLFSAMEREHRYGGARLLFRHGLRRAGRDWRCGEHGPSAIGFGGRRRVPDDRVRARQLPPLRPRSGGGVVQQFELGNAAGVPARIAVQRSLRLARCRHGSGDGRVRRARCDAGRACARARRGGRAPRRLFARRSDAAARCDLRHVARH
jgi:hypothetical protein